MKETRLIINPTKKEIDEYLLNRSKAIKDGINILNIMHYKIVESDNTACLLYSLDNDISGIDDNIIIYKKDESSEMFAQKYLENINQYVNKLQEISSAPTDMYNKLVSDYLSLYNYNLLPPSGSNGYLYSREKGFIISDVTYNTDNILIEDDDIYLKNLVQGLIGRNIPKAIINSETVMVMAQSYLDKILTLLDTILVKLANAFKKYNYLEEEVNAAIEYKYSILLSSLKNNIMSDDLVYTYIENKCNKNNKQKTRRTYDNNFSK